MLYNQIKQELIEEGVSPEHVELMLRKVCGGIKVNIEVDKFILKTSAMEVTVEDPNGNIPKCCDFNVTGLLTDQSNLMQLSMSTLDAGCMDVFRVTAIVYPFDLPEFKLGGANEKKS